MTQNIPNTRIELGGYFADIVMNRTQQPEDVYYYIIQKKGSAEVVDWGKADSFEQIERLASSTLKTFASRDSLRASGTAAS